MIDSDGTLDLRGVFQIKEREYEDNYFIKKVIIGSSIQTIGKWAFLRCHNLEEILFEEPCQIMTLERGSFSRCEKLRKIEIPFSIRNIDLWAFYQCPLQQIIIHGPCKIICKCFETNALTYVHFSDCIEIIDKDAFYQNLYVFPSRVPCKIYIPNTSFEKLKDAFQERVVEFSGNELNEGYVLK